MIRPFGEPDVPIAAALLADRHERHRAAQPLLSPPRGLEAQVAELWARSVGGVVAESAGEVSGYLLGTSKTAAAWGPNVWVETAGWAGADVGPLYASAAAGWVGHGLRAHYVVVPTGSDEPWFRLGFGLQHLHAVRPVATLEQDPRVRRAVRADVPALAALDLVLDEHLVGSPVFSAAPVTPYEDALKEWEESFDDPDYAVFVAEVDGQVVASSVGCDVGKSSTNTGLIAPDGAALLGFVAVQPVARGGGLGTALGAVVVTWAAEQGFTCLVTDWRSANLGASRTWPKLGFEESFQRLHRLVGY